MPPPSKKEAFPKFTIVLQREDTINDGGFPKQDLREGSLWRELSLKATEGVILTKFHILVYQSVR